jgi:hypothetical protein
VKYLNTVQGGSREVLFFGPGNKVTTDVNFTEIERNLPIVFEGPGRERRFDKQTS